MNDVRLQDILRLIFAKSIERCGHVIQRLAWPVRNEHRGCRTGAHGSSEATGRGVAFSFAASPRNLFCEPWHGRFRCKFAHPLGQPFSIPVAGGEFPQPLTNLSGIPTDGGFGTVDAANHSIRAADENAFTFNRGPSKRSVFTSEEEGMEGTSSLPGGVSGVPGSKYYANLLPEWLRNQAYRELFREGQLRQNILSIDVFTPPEE